MVEIPGKFAKTMAEVHGDAGVAWVEGLPGLLATYAQQWQLELGDPFALSYNYVVAARRADGTPAVLKAGVPHKELLTELAALRHYDGDGMARLLEADDAAGVFLLERAEPGTTLRETIVTQDDDDAATRIAAEVMRRLWKPLPADHPFPTTADWGRGFERLRAAFDGGTGPFPKQLVETAESIFRDVHASAAPSVLLHGDLHHDNILAAGRVPWIAIDPKGIVGEPAYETGALLRNPSPWLYDQPDPVAVLRRRVSILADELGFERQRIHQWNVAQAVLSAWWTYEDHGTVRYDYLAFIERLRGLVR